MSTSSGQSNGEDGGCLGPAPGVPWDWTDPNPTELPFAEPEPIETDEELLDKPETNSERYLLLMGKNI